MTTATYKTTIERQIERDKVIYNYHVSAPPAGLTCPVCGQWSPLSFDSPQGVRLICSYKDCRAEAILPRVPLVRALKRNPTNPRRHL